MELSERLDLEIAKWDALNKSFPCDVHELHLKLMRDCREALSNSEPVGEISDYRPFPWGTGREVSLNENGHALPIGTQLFTHPAREHNAEPVAWYCPSDGNGAVISFWPEKPATNRPWKPLYDAPVASERRDKPDVE